MVYGSAASRGDLEPTQPPIQQAMGAPSQGMKCQGRETDQSLSSSGEVKKRGAILLLPDMFLWHSA